MISRRVKKVLCALALSGALLGLNGCAIVYYQRVPDKDRSITEFGLLGVPQTISDHRPGGLIPLYRSYAPTPKPHHEPKD